MGKFSLKKQITLGSLAILTGVAATGCLWQSRRYKESKFRWDRINHMLNNFEPVNLDSVLPTWSVYQLAE
jgi:hypothetical protein